MTGCSQLPSPQVSSTPTRPAKLGDPSLPCPRPAPGSLGSVCSGALTPQASSVFRPPARAVVALQGEGAGAPPHPGAGRSDCAGAHGFPAADPTEPPQVGGWASRRLSRWSRHRYAEVPALAGVRRLCPVCLPHLGQPVRRRYPGPNDWMVVTQPPQLRPGPQGSAPAHGVSPTKGGRASFRAPGSLQHPGRAWDSLLRAPLRQHA